MNELQGSSNRRSFHLAVIYGVWAVITGALTVPAAIYLLFPPRAKREPQWIDVGELAALPAGTPEEVVFRRNRIDGWKVLSEKTTAWVVKFGEDKVVAYGPQCTHLGCAYHWDDQNKNFLCPCHTSTFGLDGSVLSGPAPRPLDRYETKIENSHLMVGPLQPPMES